MARAVSLTALAMLLSVPLHAGIVFFDNFESGLSQWPILGSGAIVQDPLNPSNQVLHFNSPGSGGDIFSQWITLDPTKDYVWEFDFMATSGALPYAGYQTHTAGYLGPPYIYWEFMVGHDFGYGVLSTTGTWQHFSMPFTGLGDIRLTMEDAGGPWWTSYFDNVTIAEIAEAPEPAGLAAAGFGVLAAALARRRRATR